MQGETDEPASCPGLFCGRLDRWTEGRDNVSKRWRLQPTPPSPRYSSCGPCPRGQRALRSLCEPCTEPPSLYDWLYLTFTALFALLAHWVAIGAH